MAHAFLSKRIVTPQGTWPGALLVEDEKITAICRPSEIPAHAVIHDRGNDALLPGLVDTHVHINQPGRTEWEGFPTATRAAAAGGYTTLIDMPLNCLPETTTVAALEQKRSAAQQQHERERGERPEQRMPAAEQHESGADDRCDGRREAEDHAHLRHQFLRRRAFETVANDRAADR